MSALFEIEVRELAQWIKDQWGLEFKAVRPEFDIQGSPERSLFRCVFEERSGRLFLLEKFPRETLAIKQQISQVLDYLNRLGLPEALSPEKTLDGRALPFYKGFCYQVSAFLGSTALDRPGWLSSPEMGRNMADFLIRMEKASGQIPREIPFSPFSIKSYILKLFSQMRVHDTKMYDRYAPYLAFLEREFMDIHDRLPLKFCHGDFHPLNVIWDQFRIKAVIDWEFTGLKPDLYDAATLVGCGGIENPDGLAMPMVTCFLERIREAGIVSPMGWHYFPEYVLALRFAWLSEWLRKKDHEMLEMEADYMGILVSHRERLREIWNLDR